MLRTEIEKIDDDSQQYRETFAQYGLTMYQAQCLEKSLAILVSTVFNKEFHTSQPDRRKEIQDVVFTKTVGRLINSLKKQIAVPPNLDRNLYEALQKRNWLAHDYFWERAGHFMTRSGRDKMINELIKLSEFFSKLDAHLTKIYETWAKKTGLTQETIEEGIRKLIHGAEEII